MDMQFDPIDRDVLFEGFGTPDERSKLLVEFAREQLAEAQRINRQGRPDDVPFVQIVDGQRGAELETVRPDGTIVFDFDLVRGVLEWIGEQLVKHSPVRTGRYANSHILLADGNEVAMPGAIPPAREYVFINDQPYARKIEDGLSDQASEGVYDAVAALAGDRFDKIAGIYFGWRALAQQAGAKPGRERQRVTRAPDTRRPCIIVNT